MNYRQFGILVLSAVLATSMATQPLHSQQQTGSLSGGARIKPPRSGLPEQTSVLPLAFLSENVVGMVEMSTLGKSLSIRWSFDDANGDRKFQPESFDLNYWPTAAARVNDDRLTAGTNFLVAGKRPGNGHTVIERWDLSFSSTPGTVPTTVNKTIIYDAKTVGKKVVRTLAPVNGTSGAAFVHFADSSDLYRIDATDGTLVLVLAPVQAPELMHESYTMFTGGKTTSGAYVYIYQCNFSHYNDGALILTDLDGDGLLDAWASITNQEWSTVQAIPWAEHYEG